jgi:hypothetical protein
MLTRITVSALFLTLSASAAIAGGNSNPQVNPVIQNDINKIVTVIDNRIDNQCGGNSYRCGRGAPVAAPEIDPAQAISALMLLAGSVAVLRGRRKAK